MSYAGDNASGAGFEAGLAGEAQNANPYLRDIEGRQRAAIVSTWQDDRDRKRAAEWDAAWRRGHRERQALRHEHPEGLQSLYGHYRPAVFEGGQGDWPLPRLLDALTDPNGPWQLDLEGPDYQRDHVWTRDQQAAFMGHILGGGYPGLIVLNRLSDECESHELVDGKQRLEAIRRWFAGEIPALLHDGRAVRYPTLTGWSQTRGIGRVFVQVAICVKSRAEILELYLKLNGGGTPHTEEELERVRQLWAAAREAGEGV